MSAVEPIFQVHLGLTNQIVRAEKIPVENLYSQVGLHGEGSLHIKAFAKDGVELFWDVVFLVVDGGLAEQNSTVGISLAIQISRVKVIGLKTEKLRWSMNNATVLIDHVIMGQDITKNLITNVSTSFSHRE